MCVKLAQDLSVLSLGQGRFWPSRNPRDSLGPASQLDNNTTAAATTQQLCSLISVPPDGSLTINADHLHFAVLLQDMCRAVTRIVTVLHAQKLALPQEPANNEFQADMCSLCTCRGRKKPTRAETGCCGRSGSARHQPHRQAELLPCLQALPEWVPEQQVCHWRAPGQ